MSAVCLANNKVSTTGADILIVPIEPRALAMGQAYTGLSDDIYGLNYNPAGMVINPQCQGSLMYRNSIEDMFYGSGAFIWPLNRMNVLGVNISFFNQGSFELFKKDGTIQNMDIGNSYRIGLSYAHFFRKYHLALGSTLKLIKTELSSYSASGVAFDMGLLYSLNSFSIGLAVRNMGNGLKYIKEEDPLPLIAKAGIAYRYILQRTQNPMALVFTYDVVKDKQYEGIGFDTGLEFDYHDLIFARAGYQFKGDFSIQDNNGISAGLGIKYRKIQADYGFKLSSSDLVSTTHSFAVTYRFSSVSSYPEKRQRKKKYLLTKEKEKKTVKTIKLQEIDEIDKKITSDIDNIKISKEWQIQYSTNMVSNQEIETIDFSNEPKEKEKIKWVRWVPKNKNKEKDSIIFKVEIE